jgi:hypothetical protein
MERLEATLYAVMDQPPRPRKPVLPTCPCLFRLFLRRSYYLARRAANNLQYEF